MALDWRISAQPGDEVHCHIETSSGRVVVEDSLNQEGSEIDAPTESTTYQITATGRGGMGEEGEASVVVIP